jgi:four helix bundle protein
VARDPKKLQVYHLAHELVLAVYRVAPRLPPDERFGLAQQLKRAAVSVPTNIVEGSVRRSAAGYARYLEVALGSAVEVRYLLDLVRDLGPGPRCGPRRVPVEQRTRRAGIAESAQGNLRVPDVRRLEA